jgi:medium-chain acyl-[acyl-carrier-protein] hydrolase
VRVFCFPYAGGGCSTYSAWSALLPEEIEVCPVQLPGRETRITEPPYTTIEALIPPLVEALLPYLDMPFALFGHSMGALISFEVARYLSEQYAQLPVRLVVSAHRAPHLPDTKAPIHHLPAKDFVHELLRLQGTPAEAASHDELLQLILPTLRADFTLCETYTYQQAEPLSCPITALGGLQDHAVPRSHLEAWQAQTKATFQTRFFIGNHFFIKTAQHEILRTLTRELLT